MNWRIISVLLQLVPALKGLIKWWAIMEPSFSSTALTFKPQLTFLVFIRAVNTQAIIFMPVTSAWRSSDLTCFLEHYWQITLTPLSKEISIIKVRLLKPNFSKVSNVHSAIEKTAGTKIEIYPKLKAPSYQKKHELYVVDQTTSLLTDSATVTKRS